MLDFRKALKLGLALAETAKRFPRTRKQSLKLLLKWGAYMQHFILKPEYADATCLLASIVMHYNLEEAQDSHIEAILGFLHAWDKNPHMTIKETLEHQSTLVGAGFKFWSFSGALPPYRLTNV